MDVMSDCKVSILIVCVNTSDPSGSSDRIGDGSQIVLLCGFMYFS